MSCANTDQIDRRFQPWQVPERLVVLFLEAMQAFPQCEIWERWENIGRRLLVGIVNRSTQVAVTILLSDAHYERVSALSNGELERIAEHLTFAKERDLSLGPRLNAYRPTGA